MGALLSRKAEAAVIIVVVIIIFAFVAWVINFASKECRSDKGCSEDYYCGSDFTCHKIPTIEKT